MPHETTEHFHRLRLVDPGLFTPGSFRTLRVGSHRVVLGHLKGEHRRVHGRLKLTAQAILHPKREMIPGCRGCAGARHFIR